MTLSRIGWDSASIKRNRDCHGLGHIKYIKIHAFTMIVKKKKKRKKENSSLSFGSLLGYQVITLKVDG